MLRYIPYILAFLGILFAIIFASAWSGETQRPERQSLNDIRVDVMGLVSGATCEYGDDSADVKLSVLYFAPAEATFVWQMIVPGQGVVWEHTETTASEFFYSATSRGIEFTAQPEPYFAVPNTPIRIEASAYRGQNTSARPADFSMIEFDCTSGAVVNSTITEDVAE